MPSRSGRQCYHCKQWVEPGEAHDCWTTTEAALTGDLPEDLREAWERLRETAADFGDQRIYASHHSIMFSRTSCYFFVRPKRNYLEICIFLRRPIVSPQVRRVESASASKLVHILRITHRDEVEAPITDWLREAYDVNVAPPPRAVRRATKKTTKTTKTPKAEKAKKAKTPRVAAARTRR